VPELSTQAIAETPSKQDKELSEDAEVPADAKVSLWYVFSRIIHSDRFEIERGRIPTPDDKQEESTGEAAWAFIVASDRDEGKPAMIVLTEDLLEEFLELEEAIRTDLPRLRLEK
jgi:hypothetical protein